jgi:hypothetical protein
MTSGTAQIISTVLCALPVQSDEIVWDDGLFGFSQMPQHVNVSADHRDESDCPTMRKGNSGSVASNSIALM